jgi:hypothetical protein
MPIVQQQMSHEPVLITYQKCFLANDLPEDDFKLELTLARNF